MHLLMSTVTFNANDDAMLEQKEEAEEKNESVHIKKFLIREKWIDFLFLYIRH